MNYNYGATWLWFKTTVPVGESCLAGLPNGKSCTNTQHTEGISVHRFPTKNEAVRRKWIEFAQITSRSGSPKRVWFSVRLTLKSHILPQTDCSFTLGEYHVQS